ncbi:MAG TPA: site-2 protease family protein [Candidatus Methylacidiphilales bacterium]|nr:site-2 protease family protein [Candidatus Methylacidiphilales bacterium]
MDPIEPTFTVMPPSQPRPQPPKPKRGGLIGAVIAAGAVLVKFATPLLVLLKTGGTMLLSIGAYSLFWGWKFAAGLVLLIFVHEMGHFISARCYRIPVTAPTFIPLFGAYVLLKNRPMDPWTNAIISYAGPLAGGLGGWACYCLAGFYDEEWIMAVALYTFILNLFNLLPIPPMDGSHIWICFSKNRTPGMGPSDRVYLGFFVAALIAGLVLGCMDTWGNLPPPSSLAPR